MLSFPLSSFSLSNYLKQIFFFANDNPRAQSSTNNYSPKDVSEVATWLGFYCMTAFYTITPRFIEEDQNLTNGNIVRVGYCENASSDFLSALFLIKTDMRNKIVQCSFKFSHWTLSFNILEKMCTYFCLLTFNSFLLLRAEQSHYQDQSKAQTITL